VAEFAADDVSEQLHSRPEPHHLKLLDRGEVGRRVVIVTPGSKVSGAKPQARRLFMTFIAVRLCRTSPAHPMVWLHLAVTTSHRACCSG